VVKDAANVLNDTIDFFGIVQAIYIYIHIIFFFINIPLVNTKKYLPNLTLEPLSDSRWESRVKAISPLRYNLGEIYDGLFKLSTDGSRDANTRRQANSFSLRKELFRFMCKIVLWHKYCDVHTVGQQSQQRRVGSKLVEWVISRRGRISPEDGS
jgi:hypothetical protein